MDDELDEWDAEGEPRLNAAIAEYLASVQSPAPVTRAALLRKYPDLAESLNSFFDDLDHFRQATEPRQEEAGPSIAAALSPENTQDFSPQPRPVLRPATRRFGDYDLEGEIARGGMGVVYRATQISLNRPVALKMILAGALAARTDIERFHREAEAAARLDHPHVVPIYEVGEQDGQHYFSMKLVEGGDLSQNLTRFAGNPQAAARFMAAVAEAVHHAHQRGILHRDLKPRNILLDRDGEPLVTDFGLAKRVDAGVSDTQSGAVVGTAGYMAPEQARGDKSLTTAVDVYSLGAILYELLAGRPPFRAATLPEALFQVLHAEPQRLYGPFPKNCNILRVFRRGKGDRPLLPERPAGCCAQKGSVPFSFPCVTSIVLQFFRKEPYAADSGVDRDLETICLTCLKKEPERRYGSALALADDLKRWLEHRPIAARPVSDIERVWRWCRRNPAWAGGSLLFLTSIAAFSWQLWNENRQTRQALQKESVAVRRAVQASHEAQIHLARGLYEQSRAVNSTRDPESRWEVLKLVRQSESICQQQRAISDDAIPAELRNRLPSSSDLRQVAASALFEADARLIWKQEAGSVQPGLAPGGPFAVCQSGGGIRLLDLALLQERVRWDHPDALGTALAVDASGHWLASWRPEQDSLTVWDLVQKELSRTLPWPERPPDRSEGSTDPALLVSSELSWSANARFLAAIDRRYGDRTRQSLVLWDVKAGGPPRVLSESPADTDRGGACFNPDGTLIAYATDSQTVLVWDCATGTLRYEARLPGALIGRPALDSTGRFLACPCINGADSTGEIITWNLAENREMQRIQVSSDLKAAVVACDDAGQRLAVGMRNGGIAAFEMLTGRRLFNLAGAHPFGVSLLQWGSSGKRLVSWGIMESVIRCWEVATPLRTELETGSTFRRFALSPDGRQIAVCDAQTPRVRILDRLSGIQQSELSIGETPSTGLLIFDSKGEQLAEIDTHRTLVFNVRNSQFVARLERDTGLNGAITSVVYTAEGDMWACVVTPQPRRLTVLDVLRREIIWQSPVDMLLDSGCLVGDGRFVAAILEPRFGRQPELTLVETKTGRIITRTQLPGMPLEWSASSPDGQWLATLRYPEGDPMFAMYGAQGSSLLSAEVVLVSVPDCQQQTAIVGSSIPTTIAFNSDCTLLAVGYRNGDLQLCRLPGGEELLQCPVATSALRQIAFGRDDSFLAISTDATALQLVHLSELRRELSSIGLAW